MHSNTATINKMAKFKLEAADVNASFYRLFSSSEGEKVLKHLEEVFYDTSSIVPGDPYATHAKAGAREVLIYIKQKINLMNKEHVNEA